MSCIFSEVCKIGGGILYCLRKEWIWWGGARNLCPKIRDFETLWMEICLADTKIQNIHQFQVFPKPQIIRYTTWLSYLVTTKYANCRNRNMTQENVCFADSLKLLTPIIVSTHCLPISRKKQKKSIEEKIKMNETRNNEPTFFFESVNSNFIVCLDLSMMTDPWSSLSWLSGEGPPSSMSVSSCNDVSVIIIMAVSPICPNVTITCLCCDGFSEIYFLSVADIILFL